MTIAGRHVVVTGGGTGVGAEIAGAYGRAGAKVTIMGRTRDSLIEQGLSYQVCDVTSSQSVSAAFDAARFEHGPVAAVVANAGVANSAPFLKTTPQMLSLTLDVNVLGVVNAWQAGLPDMLDNGWGRLIAIASTASLRGYPYVSAYCASKHAVIGLTRSVALEVATKGVTANAICPGYIETPLLDRTIENIVSTTAMDSAAAREHLQKSNPQRRFIETEEVAQTALWLSSDAARGVNGHSLSLSGGEV